MVKVGPDKKKSLLSLSVPFALSLMLTWAAAPAPAEHGVIIIAESLTFEHLDQKSGIVGLNYQIGDNGYPVVADIYKDSPADKGGVQSGDEIKAIDDQDTRFIGYLHLQTLLSGPGGSTVVLKIGRPDKSEKTVTLTREAVETFNDPTLNKYGVAKWHNKKESEELLDLPFDLLSRENNRPTLFEFSNNESSKDSQENIAERIKKHSDGAYILSQCKIVRLTPADAGTAQLRKYFQLGESYALVPVYQPWLVTVKAGDVFKGQLSESQLEHLAQHLVHNSIRVQVSHTVAKQKSLSHAGEKLNKRPGLAHRSVIKRVYQELPENSGIAGLGFSAGAAGDDSGYAVVTEIFKNGPAARAGIKSGDRILTVNDVNTRYMGLEHIQKALTGPVDKTVWLTVVSAGAREEDKKGKQIGIRLEAPEKFAEPDLQKIKIAVWKEVVSNNPDDSDECELPCCLVARAGEKATIFEFCDNSYKSQLKERAEAILKNKDVQVVTIRPVDPDYLRLRNYFEVKGHYAVLPVYTRSQHKTLHLHQISSEPLTDKQIESVITQ